MPLERMKGMKGPGYIGTWTIICGKLPKPLKKKHSLGLEITLQAPL